MVVYSNASHNCPLICDQNGKIHQLNARGYRLGNRFNSTYRDVESQLHQGDTLFLFSDGVIEVMSEASEKFPEGEEYGIRRLRRVLKQNMNMSSEKLLLKVLSTVEDFRRSGALEDDVTAVCGRVVGVPSKQAA